MSGLSIPIPNAVVATTTAHGAGEEGVLRRRPLVRLHPGVVVERADAVAAEEAREPLARLAGAGVDDRRAVRPREPRQQRPLAVLLRVDGVDGVAEVRPDDARAHDVEVAAERAADLGLGVGGGGGGEAEHRRLPELGERGPDEQVVRAEVVAPHAHAVHLVDDDEADPRGRERLDEVAPPQALGRGEQERHAAGGERAEPRLDLVRRRATSSRPWPARRRPAAACRSGPSSAR